MGMNDNGIRRIEELWNAGLDTFGIAKELGVKESVIDNFLHDFILKTRHPRWPGKRSLSEDSASKTESSNASPDLASLPA